VAALLMFFVSAHGIADAQTPARAAPARPVAITPLAAAAVPSVAVQSPAKSPVKTPAKPPPAKSSAAAKPAAKPPATVKLDGVDYIDVIAFARALGMKARWLAPLEELALQNDKLRIVLKHDSREISVNGMRVFTGDTVRGHKGTLRVSQTDAEFLLSPIINAGRGRSPIPALKTIVLDPGHGGTDHGKKNDKLKLNEKTLALDTALRLKKILEARGYKIVMTRAADVKVELAARAVAATTAKADLFVSIHFNSVPQNTQKVRGLEVYRFTPRGQAPVTRGGVNSEDREKNPADPFACWNTLAAFLMQRSLLDDLKLVDRGAKHHKFAVLRLAPCPSLLIEGGFLSNDTEARLIATPAFRQKLAQSIANGITAYADALVKAGK
jgi:N-acetylmuramoyl-L-alanine amidase